MFNLSWLATKTFRYNPLPFSIPFLLLPFSFHSLPSFFFPPPFFLKKILIPKPLAGLMINDHGHNKIAKMCVSSSLQFSWGNYRERVVEFHERANCGCKKHEHNVVLLRPQFGRTGNFSSFVRLFFFAFTNIFSSVPSRNRSIERFAWKFLRGEYPAL